MRGDHNSWPEDYDLDLSDLDPEAEYCKICNDESFLCDCDLGSERSYQDSDDECYYEMKEEREERKRELRDERAAAHEEKKEAVRQSEAKRTTKKAPQKTTKKSQERQRLPPWYYRVTALREKEYPDSWDFEEDLSDLDEGPKKGCKCSEYEDYDPDWDDCECETERSYDGSNADLYYEMRRERENFKQNMKNTKAEALELQQDVLATQVQVVAEVKEVYAALRKAAAQRQAKPTLRMKRAESFYLYSIDYVTHCFDAERWRTMHVQFIHPAELDDPVKYPPFSNAPKRKIDKAAIRARANASSRLRSGQVHFSGDHGGGLADFKLPRRAGRKKQAVKSEDGKHTLLFQFINNDYVIMTAPRGFVCGDGPVSPSAPDKFKFYGICRDVEMASRMKRELESDNESYS